MEDLNIKNHPSLPSNYVTILDLQQRWLKQQQQEKEKTTTSKHSLKQRGDTAIVVRTHETAPRSGARNQRTKQYRPKNRTNLGTDSRSIAGTRDQNADLDSKGNKTTKNIEKKKMNRNRKLKEKNERRKCQGSEIYETDAKKSATESESNEKKNSDATLEQVEQKFGGLSIDSRNSKNIRRFKRVTDGYDGRSYGYGGGHVGGKGFRRRNNLVWVRKDCIVGGEIET